MVRIQRLPASRWADYRALRLEALRTDAAAFGSSYEEELKHRPHVWKERLGSCIFAVSEGLPVGMISVVFNDRAKTRHVADIFGFYVTPDARGKGVGRALLNAAVAAARKRKGVLKLELSVNPEFQPALSLYDGVGFEATGTAKKALNVGGRFYDLLNMELHFR